jgi:cell division protein FtsB
MSSRMHDNSEDILRIVQQFRSDLARIAAENANLKVENFALKKEIAELKDGKAR